MCNFTIPRWYILQVQKQQKFQDVIWTEEQETDYHNPHMCAEVHYS